MQKFADRLKDEIKKGLPGTEVQWEMASSDRMVKDFPRSPKSDSTIAAVLIILYHNKGSVSTVFIQRPEYNGVHSGQISFPGGKKEASDADIIQTAIREANEETGIEPSGISVIGTLTPLYIPVSDIMVTPVVGWIDKKPVFNRKTEEVVFLFEADITKLLDPSIIKTKPFKIRDEMINIRYFDYKGHIIWGATAMILYELLIILRRGA